MVSNEYNRHSQINYLSRLVMEDEFEDLDGEDSQLLNKRGWFLVTYFQCRKDKRACDSREQAITKAKSIDRRTGIRTVEKEDYVVFEVWDYWK